MPAYRPPMADFTSIDGGRVTIGGAGLGVEQAGGSMVADFRGELGRREFTVLPVSWGEGEGGAVEEGVRLTEEFTLSTGGRLRTGSKTATDPVSKFVARPVLGVWLGSRFSVHSWIVGNASKESEAELTAAILNIFNQFTFTELPTGVVMTSLDPKQLALVRDGPRAPVVARYVKGLGLVVVFQRTPEQERRIPRGPGAFVAGGELWLNGRVAAQAESNNGALITFLLASDTAIAHVMAEDAPEWDLLDRSSRLTIDWRAAV